MEGGREDGGKDGSRLLDSSQRTAEKSITFPAQHRHLASLIAAPASLQTPTAPSIPAQTVITPTWTNILL